MAKIIGPFLSLDASGTVAKTLTASKWKGINYMRQRVIPANPQTTDQTNIRNLISDASKAWQQETSPIDTSYKAAYDTAASGQAYSGFNLFMRDCVAKNGGSAYDGSLAIPTEPGDQTP